MNVELKALIKSMVDLANAVKAAMGSGGIAAALAALPALLADVEACLANKADLQAELAALSNSANQADLEAYILSELQALGVSAKVTGVITAIGMLVNDGLKDIPNLIAALKAA